MAKNIPEDLNGAMDQMLAVIGNGISHATVTSSQPGDWVSISGVTLAEDAAVGAMAYADESGGRKLTIPACSDSSANNAGDGSHVVYHNGTDEIFAITTITPPVTIAESDTVNIGAVVLDMGQPT